MEENTSSFFPSKEDLGEVADLEIFPSKEGPDVPAASETACVEDNAELKIWGKDDSSVRAD